jgi:4-amino-4-deoxy-L-arabinose transferase-like glycosyltransferase
MFVDGVTYAVLARNLAIGQGTFWNPFYTATIYPQFHEQPPFGIALESLAFTAAGDHLAVERVFSVLLGLTTLGLIVALWRSTFGDRRQDWLPLLFWLLPSTVTWAVINNMLENTQAALTTAAVWMCVRAMRRESPTVGWASGAAALAAAAVLVKGPTGLFPLAAPAIAALTVSESRPHAMRASVTMVLVMLAISAGIFASPSARVALTEYWHQHLGAAISGARGGGRLAAVGALAYHLAGGVFLRMGAMLGLVWLTATLLIARGARRGGDEVQWTRFFFLIALTASIPVLVSTKIVGHYLVPSIPLFALGFAGAARRWVAAMQQRYEGARVITTAIGSVGAALLLIAIVLPFLPIPIEPRDVRWIAEYRVIGAVLPRGSVIGTCSGAATDWGLHAYMQRFFNVSLDPRSDEYAYYLQLKDRACGAPTRCRPRTESERLTLYECRPV